MCGARRRGDEPSVSDRERYEGLLYRVLRRCSANLDLGVTLEEALNQTIEALGAERGSLFLLDPAERVIRRIGAQPGIGEDEFDRRVERVVAEGLAGWAIRHRQVALAADTQQDERWYHFPEDLAEAGSAIAVPLVHGGEVVGVMTLQHSQRGFFSADDAALAEAVAAQVAIAVTNARLHDAARRDRRVLLDLLAALPDPVLLIDLEGRVVRANERARLLLGTGIVGRPLRAAVDSPEVVEAFQAVVEQGAPQTVEVELGEGRCFDVALVPVVHLGVVLRLHDVTRLRRLDELKSQVVAAVSHDLRSPLAYVQGFAETLAEEEDLSDVARQCVEGILAGARRMYALIDDLLDLARIEEGSSRVEEACELASMVDAVVGDLARRMEAKEQSVEIDVPADLPSLQMGSLDLQRVLTNLIDNAVKYTQVKGHIRVTARRVGEGVRVSVADDGPGIPAEAQGRLFERFYRASSEGEGTGLGLSIVRALVERQGGRVGFESEVGKGSTFWFWLPWAAPGASVS
ncbi:MAG TPA: GAF domain-containing sensor histidine kinase [Chloroflexi bacterium]|nr:GAF domain-containing sensor histidine kinase [Chloroflexota bacterium]